MNRRGIITLFGGAAAAWPLSARAQQAGKLPTIGFLGTSTPADLNQRSAAFVQRLRELGWIEGRTIAIEYRWAEGRDGRFAEIAADLVRLKVAVIVTVGSAVPAVKQATSVIPIVFAISGDPVGMGLVASLAQPGGNVTGLSSQATDLAGKRVEMLREVVPVSADWQSWPMSVIPPPCWICARPCQRPAWSGSKPSHRKSSKPRISRLVWRRSGAARMHSTSVATRSSSPIAFVSTSWHWGPDCPRCTARGSMSRVEV
jgi:hypothetical protein